ncbi:MAG TPA: acyltransferase domain-containing protein, partial [Mycobacteriales bacterium]
RPGPRLLALSAASPDALERMRHGLAEHLAENLAEHAVEHSVGHQDAQPVLTLPAVAATLAGRRRFGHRQALVATDLAEAERLMRRAPTPGTRSSPNRIAFLFPGQGTLRTPAGAVPYRLLPGFRASFDEIRDLTAAELGLDLSPVVAEDGAPDGWFRNTVHQQLGLFALGWALARQLATWGVKPAVMLGNSIGEYVAAALAGTWTLPNAVRLVHQRARAMWDTEPGLMAAVGAPAAEVRERINSGREVTIAVDTPGAVVISGSRHAMEELLTGEALRGLDVHRLDVERAFHCATMDPAAQVLAAAVAAVPSRRPGGRLISNSTGDYADPDLVRTPDYWARHLRQPVLLDASMSTLLDSGCDMFVELGPGMSMIAALRRSTGWDTGHTTVPLLGRAGDEELGLLRALATLWEHGVDQALDGLDHGGAIRCSLPGYPFAGQDPQDDQAPPAGRPEPAPPVRVRENSAGDPDLVRRVLEQCWCAALGVPSASGDDDFFALGGESLTAVNLLSRIEERTGVAVSVTEFSRDSTFGGLVRLAGQERSAHERPTIRVVTLNEGGPGRPLFLAADAAGNALSYRALAAEFDGVRPVVGLEPADAAAAGLTIEDSAAHHVAAVRRRQPSGPYTIGGWSFGAVIAHEMACRLTNDGEQVDALVCLDAFVSGRPGRPVGLDPGFLAGNLWSQAVTILHIGQVGRRSRQDPGLRRLLLAKSRLLARYRPGPADCPAVIFRAGLSRRAATRLPTRLSGLYGGGVRVLPADGDHWTMLAPPHVQGLARSLREALPHDLDRKD